MILAIFLTSFPELLFFIVLITAIGILLYSFGSQIIRDKLKESEETNTNITPKQVSQYFIDNGYVVCNISQVKDKNKWFVYLIKNGEYLIATAFTNGERVEKHWDFLEQ